MNTAWIGGGQSLPFVSVCIPVRGDQDHLIRLLGALKAVDWPAERMAVVVALDGPDPALVDAADRFGARSFTLERPSGSYAARNLALDHLPEETDIVAFTDADCIPCPGWIRAHVATLRDADLSGGAIEVTLRERPSPAEFVDRARHLRQEIYVTRNGVAATANLATRREVADLRFDSSLPSGGDFEFCQRATAIGYRLVYSPEAVIQHPARETSGALLRKMRRLCCGVRARPEAWRDRDVPVGWPRPGLVGLARKEKRSRGLIWELEVVALDYLAQLMLSRAVRSARRQLSAPGVRQG